MQRQDLMRLLLIVAFALLTTALAIAIAAIEILTAQCEHLRQVIAGGCK
jgi:hypothetical protein